eukprot:TRINITY_DN8583_c0_g2_i1.p1 TRINITY_DN8583_c0_g2~~TRINITY_DN8583_c0_g2_i1.p1  ORF type:complete len:263 (+),score=59.78 TRINITY_DN8583_c0_g2_i1:261-1049(+)
MRFFKTSGNKDPGGPGVFEEAFSYVEKRSGLPPVVVVIILLGILLVLYFGSSTQQQQRKAERLKQEQQKKKAVKTPKEDPLGLGLGLGFGQKAAKVGELTLQELSTYNGSDPMKPVLMAINTTIYDVSSSREFYGPSGAYCKFAGKDAGRALAKMSFEPSEINNPDVSSLTAKEMAILNDWDVKFAVKYPVAGKVVSKKKEEVLREKREAESARQKALAESKAEAVAAKEKAKADAAVEKERKRIEAEEAAAEELREPKKDK